MMRKWVPMIFSLTMLTLFSAQLTLNVITSVTPLQHFSNRPVPLFSTKVKDLLFFVSHFDLMFCFREKSTICWSWWQHPATVFLSTKNSWELHYEHRTTAGMNCSIKTKLFCRNISLSAVQLWPALRFVYVLQVVGQGHFATVFKGNYKDAAVAVKVYPAGWKDKFTTEKDIYELPLMRHAGIVHFLGAGRNPSDRSWFVVLEFAEHVSVKRIL